MGVPKNTIILFIQFTEKSLILFKLLGTYFIPKAFKSPIKDVFIDSKYKSITYEFGTSQNNKISKVKNSPSHAQIPNL